MTTTTVLYGLVEFADRVGLHPQTVKQYHVKGKLPDPDAVVGDGRLVYWTAATIDEWDRTRGRKR